MDSMHWSIIFSSILRLLFQICIDHQLLATFLHVLISWLTQKLRCLHFPSWFDEVFFNLHLYCGFKVLVDNLLLTFLFLSWWLRCIFIGLHMQVIYKKDFKYYGSYPHIALVCFVCLCPEKKDSRIKTYFLLNTQFPCHTQTLNCWSTW